MKNSGKKKIKNFSSRIEVRGENAELVREVLDHKMKADNRKTYTNTIEALIIEYGVSNKIITEENS